jgi:hypothetical protein
MEKQMKHNILTYMHHLPAEGNFCDEYGNALKPVIVQDYDRHMRYADKSDHMINSYSISRHVKMDKKIIFTFWTFSILNSFFSPHFLWFKIISSKFQTCLGQGPKTRGGRMTQPQTTPQGRPISSSSQPTQLDIQPNEHQPSERK